MYFLPKCYVLPVLFWVLRAVSSFFRFRLERLSDKGLVHLEQSCHTL